MLQTYTVEIMHCLAALLLLLLCEVAPAADNELRTRRLLAPRRLGDLPLFQSGLRGSNVQSVYPLTGDGSWAEGLYLTHPNGEFRITQPSRLVVPSSRCFKIHAAGNENPTVLYTVREI